MIHISIPFIPPSDNHAYFNLPKGGRVLTTKGKKFKEDVKNHVVKHHGMQTGEIKPDSALGAVFAFGFPQLLNRGYPKRSQNKFKKVDVNNRIKLLADALVESMNMDDSQIMMNMPYKYLSKSEETKIWIWNEDVEPIGAKLIYSFGEIVSGAVRM